jgi:hypothetical protein
MEWENIEHSAKNMSYEMKYQQYNSLNKAKMNMEKQMITWIS